jgi:hypothetical protein
LTNGHAFCQGVPVGTSGTWAERQRDKTGRLFRIERAFCQGSLKEPAARGQRDRDTGQEDFSGLSVWSARGP